MIPVKKQVETILTNFPESRNSDKTLTILIWKTYYSEKISEDGKSVLLEKLYDLPSQDGIKRIRAHIQNTEHRLPPTSNEVIKKRGQEQIRWETTLGYSTMTPELHKAEAEVEGLFKKRAITS